MRFSGFSRDPIRQHAIDDLLLFGQVVLEIRFESFSFYAPSSLSGPAFRGMVQP
jgi:hypothetical protein